MITYFDFFLKFIYYVFKKVEMRMNEMKNIKFDLAFIYKQLAN